MRPPTVVLTDLRAARNRRPIAGPCLKAWAMADPQLAGIDIRAWAPVMGEPPEAVARTILGWRPKLAGFSCYVWNRETVFRVCRALKRADAGLKIVLGGPEVSATPEEALAHPEVDWVALGEGEETFRRLLRHEFRREPLEGVPGLAFRRDGAIISFPPAAQIDLAAAPSPYSPGLLEPLEGGESAILEGSRGCPFTCKFCEWGPRNMRYVPLERLRAQFQELSRRHSMITMIDADLMMHRRRGVELLKSFIQASRGTGCRLWFNTNPAFLAREAVDVIASAPDRFIVFAGVQSINAGVLARVSRPFDLARAQRNLAYLKSKAPSTSLIIPLIYGMPDDDLAGFRRSLEWAMRIRPSSVILYHALVLPGSDMHRESAQLGLTYQREPPHRVLETTAMSRADLERATELSFYFELLWSFPELVDMVIPRSAPEEVSLVGLFEDWLAAVRAAGIDLSFGMPVAEIDGRDARERLAEAEALLRKDPMLIPQLVCVTRRFALSPDRRLDAAVA